MQLQVPVAWTLRVARRALLIAAPRLRSKPTCLDVSRSQTHNTQVRGSEAQPCMLIT
jgi:hypothetical protein